jgi:uncharacterized protein (TIGR02246 family)
MGHFSRDNARSRQIQLRAVLARIPWRLDALPIEASIAVVAPKPFDQGPPFSVPAVRAILPQNPRRHTTLNPPTQAMKRRLLVTLAGLAIGFAVPALAQQKETVDPQLIQKLDTLNKKYNEAINHQDAAAFGALYTEDASFVTDTGPVYGLKAIEKWYEDAFKAAQRKNNTATIDPRSVRMLGPDNLTYNVAWSETDKGKNGEDVPIKGYCSVVATRQGDGWKICQLTWNLTPDTWALIYKSFGLPPAAAPSPTASPSS